MEVRGVFFHMCCGRFDFFFFVINVFVCFCSYAEQLVLYIKAEEFLSSALRAAQEKIKQGHLLPSATVKQGEFTVPSTSVDETQTFIFNNHKRKQVYCKQICF